MPTLKFKHEIGSRVRISAVGDVPEMEGEVLYVYPALNGTPLYDVRVPEWEHPDMAPHRDVSVPEHRLTAAPVE